MGATDVALDAAPDMAAAQRAADELVAAGVSTVLLFGSLARGEAKDRSDIDLVAIYDDLDYSERANRRCALEAVAGKAAGYEVDVMVTDAPEWAVRTKKVPCSIEAQISGYALELASLGPRTVIDWNKEIGLPDTPTAELENRFKSMSEAISSLTRNLPPNQEEIDAAADGSDADVAAEENLRFALAMGAAHMIIEGAAKTIHVVTVGTAPAYRHSITGLLAVQPAEIGQEFNDRAGNAVDLKEVSIWRQGATYPEDRPESRFNEQYLRAHAEVAISIAEFAHATCLAHGVSAEELDRFQRRLSRAKAALGGPVRLRSRGG